MASLIFVLLAAGSGIQSLQLNEVSLVLLDPYVKQLSSGITPLHLLKKN